MASSTEILQRFLDAWGNHSIVIEKYARLHEELEGESAAVLMALMERFIQEQRIGLLEIHWGGIATATPVQAEQVTVPVVDMVRINGIMGFYNVNRAVLFLYAHAFLFEALGIDGPWMTLNGMLDELDPR